ncbi:MAG: WD40 repeat protein [Verrucomicrobiales bacterium]|jgi:WD40 repeat protein
MRVLISYSHDSDEHRKLVLGLSNRLRTNEGIDALIDQYFESPCPKEGWPDWMIKQINEANFVVLVCTESYYNRFHNLEEDADVGRGVRWEAVISTNELYDQKNESTKFIPVVFRDEDQKHAPQPLRGRSIYNVDTADGFELLVRHIRGRNRVKMPEVAEASSILDNRDNAFSLEAFAESTAPVPIPASLAVDKLFETSEPLTGFDPDLLDRVQAAWETFHPLDKIERVSEPDSPDYLHISRTEAGIYEVFPIMACQQLLEDGDDWYAVLAVDERFRKSDPHVRTRVVVESGPIDPKSLLEARKLGLILQTLFEFQGFIHFDGYRNAQTKRLAHDPIYPPKLYVPQKAEIISPGKPRILGPAVDEIEAWLCDPKGVFVLVLADPGAGKTFLLHQLALRLADPEKSTAPEPILIEMQALEKGHSIDSLVAQHFATHDFDAPAKPFRYMLREGRIALLFDGFDELELRATYDKALLHLNAILSAAEGSGHVVVTSRRNHFLTEGDLLRHVGEKVAALPGHKIIKLPTFDKRDIFTFFQQLLGSEEAAEKRIQLLQQVDNLMGLSENPRMLGFIANLDESELAAAAGADETINSATLYRKILERWFDQEIKRRSRPGSADLPAWPIEDYWKIVTCLAMELWKRDEKFLDPADLQVPVSESQIGFAVPADNLATRLSQLTTINQTAAEDAHQAGSATLLIKDEKDRFAFIHRSVMEWLVANECAQQLPEDSRPAALESEEVSRLMADFFASLAGKPAGDWADAVLQDPEADEIAKKNALKVEEMVYNRFGHRKQNDARDFSGQDLRGEDFSGQTLLAANFEGAKLESAQFQGAQLVNARFVGADLRQANFKKANLTGANLKNANLSRANLMGANLTGADLEAADFGFAKLLAEGLDTTRPPILPVTSSPLHQVTPSPLTGAALSLPAHPQFLPASPVYSVAWNQRNLIAVGTGPGDIWIADIELEAVIRVLKGHSGSVLSVAWSADGQRLASGSNDKTVRIWNPDSASQLAELKGHSDYVRSVAWSADGQRLASGSDDNTVRIWNPDSASQLAELKGHSSFVMSVAWSADGQRLASGSEDRTVRIWNPESASQLAELKGHSGSVWSVAWSADGQRLASGSSDNTVRIWNPDSASPLAELKGHSASVRSVAWSADGQRLASGSDDKTVRIWNPESASQLAELKGHSGYVMSVAWSADGQRLASGSDDNTVRIWNPESASQLAELKGHSNWVMSVAWSADGKRLASGSADKTVRIWNPESASQLAELKGHSGYVMSVAWSADGQRLASGFDDNTVRIWNPESASQLAELKGHSGSVWSVAWHPDQQLLASASADGTIRVWDAENASCLVILYSLPDGAWAAFTPEGRYRLSDNFTSGFWHSVNLCRFEPGELDEFLPEGEKLEMGAEEKLF